MARERMTITRPDLTGFAKTVHSGRPRLDAIDPVAMRSAKLPMTESASADARVGLRHPDDMPTTVATEPQMDLSRNGHAPAALTSQVHRSGDLVDTDLVELQGPPRIRAGRRRVQLSLRLRVTDRHVPLLRELETRGVPREAVLRSAQIGMPTVKLVPQYVPQVQEISAGNEWGWRVSLGVDPELLAAIAAKVRDGHRAPRSALILGQIEPTWFACLDNTITRLLK